MLTQSALHPYTSTPHTLNLCNQLAGLSGNAPRSPCADTALPSQEDTRDAGTPWWSDSPVAPEADGQGQGGERDHVSDATGHTAAAGAGSAGACAGVSGGASPDGASGHTGGETWLAEAAAAAAAVDSRACDGGSAEAGLLGRAWAAIAPACRRFACDELRKLLISESRQRERQQRQIGGMPPALLLRAPPDSLPLAAPHPHADLDGLFFIDNFVSEAEEAALMAWCDSAPWQPTAMAVGQQTVDWEMSNWNSRECPQSLQPHHVDPYSLFPCPFPTPSRL